VDGSGRVFFLAETVRRALTSISGHGSGPQPPSRRRPRRPGRHRAGGAPRRGCGAGRGRFVDVGLGVGLGLVAGPVRAPGEPEAGLGVGCRHERVVLCTREPRSGRGRTLGGRVGSGGVARGTSGAFRWYRRVGSSLRRTGTPPSRGRASGAFGPPDYHVRMQRPRRPRRSPVMPSTVREGWPDRSVARFATCGSRSPTAATSAALLHAGEVFGRDFAFLPHDQVLSFEETTRLAAAFVAWRHEAADHGRRAAGAPGPAGADRPPRGAPDAGRVAQWTTRSPPTAPRCGRSPAPWRTQACSASR